MEASGPGGTADFDCGATLAVADRLDAQTVGPASLRLDAGSRPFGPGRSGRPLHMTAEGFGQLAYEAPRSQPSTVVFGSNGALLDGARLSLGIFMLLVQDVTVDGSPLGNTVSAQGASGTGGKLPAAITFGFSTPLGP